MNYERLGLAARPVHHGDSVQIGRVSLRFRLELTRPSSAGPAPDAPAMTAPADTEPTAAGLAETLPDGGNALPDAEEKQ